MDALVDTLLWLLILLPAILIGAALIIYLLILRWQNKTLDELKEVRIRLRGYETQLRQLRSRAEAHSPEDSEPFGSLARDLFAGLDQASQQFRDLYSSFSQQQKKARLLDWRQIEDWKELQSIIRLPYEWYFMRQESNALSAEEEVLADSIQASEGLLTKLAGLGPEVARQTREVLGKAQEAQRTFAGLQSAGIQDPELEHAFEEVLNWEKRLNAHVPVYFVSENSTGEVEKADKTTIAAVYRLVNDASPAVHSAQENAKAWERRSKALDEALEELIREYRSLSQLITSLEGSPIFPLNWDHSRSRLVSARQAIESLAAAQSSRTLKQVDQDLASATRQNKALTDMAGHCQKIAEAHKEFLTLMENPEIQQGADWGRKALKSASQGEAYDPENWPRSGAPHHLRVELQRMVSLHENLKYSDSANTILESDLPVVLDEVRQLTTLHKEVRPRFKGVQERLVEIQESERNTRDLIARTRALINQAVSVVGSNHHLSQSAAVEAESLRSELEVLSDEIEARGQGTVEKKAQRANALVRKAEQAANRWLEKLGDEMDDRKAELAERVGVLDNIAVLDEPALHEAEKLLGRRELVEEGEQKKAPRMPFPLGKGERRRRQKEALSLNDAVTELKHKNEEWHRCIAAMRAIEDIEAPVLEQFERAGSQAEKAHSALLAAVDLIPEERSWPPTTVFIANERRQFEGLEKQWGALKQQPLRAIQLVNRLGELAGSYQDLENRAAQAAERASQEQTRVLEMEQRLGESLRLWQYQMQSYASNLFARDEIQMLLEEADNEAEAIRLRYLRGDRSYPQVLQELRTLCQRVESAQAPLDREQVIDINGVVQRRGV